MGRWLLIVLLSSVSSNAYSQSLDTSIRSVNWDSLLARDHAHFVFDSESTADYVDMLRTSDSEAVAAPEAPNHSFLPAFYEIRGNRNKALGGFLDTPIIYHDFNGDGKEDAVLPLRLPGSGIYGTYIVFTQTSHGPRFVDYGGGNHLEMFLSGDTLFASTGHFLFGDPNCCPRAHDLDRVVIHGPQLLHLPIILQVKDSSSWYTVEQFYDALDRRDYKDAYMLLSSDYQARHAFRKWKKEFDHVIHIEANVDRHSANDIVRLSFQRIDKVNRRTTSRRFEGVWRMCWDRHLEDWVMQEPQIAERE